MYQITRDNIYYNGVFLAQRYDNAEILSNDYYLLNGSNIYFMGKIIKNANIDTFDILDPWYATDIKFVYCMGNHFIERKKGYWFKSLGWRYAKDKNHVYYLGDVIKNADPATFITINNCRAKDKNYYYYFSSIVGVTSEYILSKKKS